MSLKSQCWVSGILTSKMFKRQSITSVWLKSRTLESEVSKKPKVVEEQGRIAGFAEANPCGDRSFWEFVPYSSAGSPTIALESIGVKKWAIKVTTLLQSISFRWCWCNTCFPLESHSWLLPGEEAPPPAAPTKTKVTWIRNLQCILCSCFQTVRGSGNRGRYCSDVFGWNYRYLVTEWPASCVQIFILLKFQFLIHQPDLHKKPGRWVALSCHITEALKKKHKAAKKEGWVPGAGTAVAMCIRAYSCLPIYTRQKFSSFL